MAWKQLKSRRGKGQLKRWSSNKVRVRGNTDTPRARIMVTSKKPEGNLGNTVLYRDHVKSYAKGWRIPKSKMFETGRYEGVPDDKVPPVILVLRQLEQGPSHFRDKWNMVVVKPGANFEITMHLSGAKAFFTETDLVMNTLRESLLYSSERARQLMTQLDRISWIRKYNLETVSPPE